VRALMVWDGDYPWDVRVEKVCQTLISAGFSTHLVCRNSDNKPRRENLDGILVRRVFSSNGKLSCLNSAITFPAFFSPIWLYEIHAAIKEVRPDVIIIRDLPIALAVIPLAKIKGIPTILDMAECYPEMIRSAWKFEKFRISNILVRNPYIADFVELLTIRNVDMIWAMIEESAERLQKKKVPKSRIRIVSNTPPINTPPLPIKPPPLKDKLKIIYVGLVNPSRGLATVIEAARILKEKSVAFEIQIVGSGKDFPRISSLIKKLSLQKEVEMMGWINHKDLGEIFSAADIGIVSHYACSHWNNTIPNKIFDYMKAGIPVLVSDVKPAKRIIETTNAGLSYRNADPQDLAEKICKLQNKMLRDELGKNGLTAIAENFNWGNDSRVLLDSIHGLLKTGSDLSR